MAKPTTIFSLTPVLPKGASIVFGLVGDAKYGLSSSSGSGGWQTIDRPIDKAATEYYDTLPREYSLSLILDGGDNALSIEPQCALLDTWQDIAPGQQQPPVLAMAGPVSVQARSRFWVVEACDLDEDRVTRNDSGNRTQQFLSMTLLEWVPTTASVLTHLSPAQAAQQALTAANASTSRKIYVAKQGDTLAKIAARVLGNVALAGNLAILNNIRDPSSIAIGTRIRLP